jgi:hypothetical protein
VLYCIEINFESFDINKVGEVARMFNYCENKYHFKSGEWERIKEEFDYESLGELVEKMGGQYTEYIE